MELIQFLPLVEKGGVVMVLIVLLSIIAAVIVIERLIYFRSRRADEEKLLQRLTSTLRKGHYEEALAICEDHSSALASLMQVGINYRHASTTELREVILDTANMEIPKEERFLSALGTIAHIAPLLGLLGTVTGNIRAFGVLGDLGAIGDASLLAGGISEALLTTAAGIIVSIPAVIFYNFLVSKVSHRMIRLEHRVSELVAMLVAAEQAGEPPQPVAAAVQGTAAPQPGAEEAHSGAEAPQPVGEAASPAAPAPGEATPHPGSEAPQPGVAAPYPGVVAPHPGVAASHPGVAAPYPGVAASRSGIHGVAAPYPGVAASHPGVAAPYPGVAAEQPGVAAPYPGVARSGGPQPGVAAPYPWSGGPATWSGGPATWSGGPATWRSSGPATWSGGPATWSSGPATWSSGPATWSSGRAARRRRHPQRQRGAGAPRGGNRMRPRRGLKPQTSINLVPMIDVVFQLVIFFMVSTTFKIVPGIDLELPASKTAEPVALTPLVLSIGDRERIYVNDRRVSIGDLDAALRENIGEESPGDHPVVVEGDASVPYDLMVDVLDVLRVLGFQAASLRTRNPNAPLPGRS